MIALMALELQGWSNVMYGMDQTAPQASRVANQRKSVTHH